jgi:hypothetical protein
MPEEEAKNKKKTARLGEEKNKLYITSQFLF